MLAQSADEGPAPSRQPTVSILTLGCKLNQAESESLSLALRRRGYRVLSHEAPADVYVVNSCSVTHVADQKSRQLLHRLRRANPEAKIVVAGCFAARAPDEVQAAERVDAVVSNAHKDELAQVVERLAPIAAPVTQPHCPANGRTGLGRARAVVKVGDGCNKFCAYCVVPYARGRERSEPLESVVAAVQERVQNGCQEAVLTAVNLGRWGADLGGDGSPMLASLLAALLEQTAIRRIRLSSIEPEDFKSDLIPFFANERICRHLHLPLQSGCDTVLRRMRRRYDLAAYTALVAALRAAVPGLAITTDVVAGFPGETDEEFDRTGDFVSQVGFAAVHVFKYSPREGTAAAGMPGQIAAAAKAERASRLAGIAEDSRRRFQRSQLGQRLEVLYEMEAEGERVSPREDLKVWKGLTDNYLRVYSPGNEEWGNHLAVTTLVGEYRDGLRGEVSQVAEHARTAVGWEAAKRE